MFKIKLLGKFSFTWNCGANTFRSKGNNEKILSKELIENLIWVHIQTFCLDYKGMGFLSTYEGRFCCFCRLWMGFLINYFERLKVMKNILIKIWWEINFENFSLTKSFFSKKKLPKSFKNLLNDSKNLKSEAFLHIFNKINKFLGKKSESIQI